MTGEDLAERVYALAEGRLPDAARTGANQALLAAAIAAMAAAHREDVAKLLAFAARHTGEKIAPVAGHRDRTDPYFSALINGVSSGVAPFGACLSLASSGGASGRRALTSFALGLEVASRLESIVSPDLLEIGWDARAVCGVIGAAVTAGLMLHLDPEALRNAIGIAVSETLGHRVAEGTDCGALQVGKAASNGVIAALLARRGFTGSASLDAYAGFFSIFPPARPGDIGRLVESLGDWWAIGSHASGGTRSGSDGDIEAAIRALDERPSTAELTRVLTVARVT